MASVTKGDIMAQVNEMAGDMATKQEIEELKDLIKRSSPIAQGEWKYMQSPEGWDLSNIRVCVHIYFFEAPIPSCIKILQDI